jgi:hypothetical protein
MAGIIELKLARQALVFEGALSPGLLFSRKLAIIIELKGGAEALKHPGKP